TCHVIRGFRNALDLPRAGEISGPSGSASSLLSPGPRPSHASRREALCAEPIVPVAGLDGEASELGELVDFLGKAGAAGQRLIEAYGKLRQDPCPPVRGRPANPGRDRPGRRPAFRALCGRPATRRRKRTKRPDRWDQNG